MQNTFSNIYLIAWGALWWLLIHSAGTKTEALACGVILSTSAIFLAAHKFSKSSMRILLIAILCGLVTDGLLLHLGFINYQSTYAINIFPPLWILCLWALLGIGVYTYPDIFRKRAALTALICFLSAPLCYWAGHRAEAIIITDHMLLTLIGVASIYALSGLVLFKFNKAETQHAQ